MENAAKALLIAGGILLALLTIALVLLVSNNIKDVKVAQTEKIYHDQLTAFNMQYEAYNKKIMYGTDVISVVNKAIDNNNLMNLTEPENKYYVDVEFTITQEMEGYVEQTVETNEGKEIDNIPIPGNSLSAGTYVLGTHTMDATVLNFFSTEADSTVERIEEISPAFRVITNVTYPAIIVFKTSIFTCESVQYNDGRITKLTFRQVREI